MDLLSPRRPIVVGFDGRPHAEDALALARVLSRLTGAPLLVVATYELMVGPGESPFEPLAEALSARADEAADRAAALLGEPVDTRVEFGAPAHVLQRVAEEEAAGLIVVGSSETGRRGRVFPGSTAEHLLHGATAPVAVAPEGYRSRSPGLPARVACGYDGSDEADVALTVARTLAAAARAELRIVVVAEPGAGPEIPGWRSARRAPEAHAVLRHGEAVPCLCQETQASDLLVMGSRGRGPLRAVLTGGVSGLVLRGAACPVLVTPRSLARRLRGDAADAVSAPKA